MEFKPFDHSTIDESLNAFRNGNFRNAANSITPSINDQIDNLLQLLDIRAAAHAQAGEYERAIQDGNMMLAIRPYRGCLRLGEIHSLRLNYSEAIKVYEQGFLYMMATTEDSQYNNKLIYMDQAYRYAKEKMEQRVDIVGKVPLEVLSLILHYVGKAESSMDLALGIYSDHKISRRLQYVTVSKLWKERIGKCPCWSSIRIDRRTWLPRNDMICLGHFVGNRIRELVLTNADVHDFNPIFRAMTNNKFNNLEKFRINISGQESFRSKHLFDGIAQLAPTLKQLVVDAKYISQSDPVIPFQTILSTFQNLESFTYEQSDVISSSLITATTNRTPKIVKHNTLRKLTNLRLSLKTFDVDATDKILAFCPELRGLWLESESTSSAVIDTIRLNCKKLETLGYNDIPVEDNDLNYDQNRMYGFHLEKIAGPTDSTAVASIPSDGTLQKVAIYADNPVSVIESLLAHYSTTIKVLRIKLPDSFCDTEKINTPLSNNKPASFTQLQSLFIHITRNYNNNNDDKHEHEQDYQTIAFLLRSSPNLTDLRFCDVTSFGSSVVDAIVNLDNLQQLAIVSKNVRFSPGITALMQQLASKPRDTIQLERLVLSRGPNQKLKIGDFANFRELLANTENESLPNHFFEIIEHIPYILSLKTIEFQSIDLFDREISTSNRNSKKFDEFFRALQDHPSLENLKLMKISSITGSTLDRLSNISTLKNLTLHGIINCNYIGSGEHILDTIPSLNISYSPLLYP